MTDMSHTIRKRPPAYISNIKSTFIIYECMTVGKGSVSERSVSVDLGERRGSDGLRVDQMRREEKSVVTQTNFVRVREDKNPDALDAARLFRQNMHICHPWQQHEHGFIRIVIRQLAALNL